MQRQSILGLLSLCLVGLSACPSNSSTPTQQPTPSASSSPGPSTSATPTPVASTGTEVPDTQASNSPGVQPTAEPQPSASGNPGFTLPDNAAAIRFASSNNRFLNQQGDSTTFATELVDRNGNVIALENVPLEWSSSRPQDFSVDANGKLTALVNAGFSTITVRVAGTNLEARSVINVAGGGSSGGGGGGGGSVSNSPPVITSLNASDETVAGTGTLVQLSAAATDANNTLSDSSYTWSCSQANCGEFTSTTGPLVYWRTPDTSGTYDLTLTVSDGQTTTTQNVSITVNTGQGNLDINAPPP